MEIWCCHGQFGCVCLAHRRFQQDDELVMAMGRSRVTRRGKLGVCRQWSHDTGVPTPGLPTQVRHGRDPRRETLLVNIGSRWTRPSLISQTRKESWVTGQVRQRWRTRDTGAITCVKWHSTRAQLRVITSTDIGPLKYSFEDG